MFLKAQPIGVNVPSDLARQPIWRAVSGDDLAFTTRITTPSGQPATPINTRVHFALAENRFATPAIWEGQWASGITEVDSVNHPGLIRVRIPEDVANTLRRGSYSFSLTVSDVFKRQTVHELVGTLIVEYEATSPNHNIPYRG